MTSADSARWRARCRSGLAVPGELLHLADGERDAPRRLRAGALLAPADLELAGGHRHRAQLLLGQALAGAHLLAEVHRSVRVRVRPEIAQIELRSRAEADLDALQRTIRCDGQRS